MTSQTIRLPSGAVVRDGAVIHRQQVPIVRELRQINMRHTMLAAAITVALSHG